MERVYIFIGVTIYFHDIYIRLQIIIIQRVLKYNSEVCYSKIFAESRLSEKDNYFTRLNVYRSWEQIEQISKGHTSLSYIKIHEKQSGLYIIFIHYSASSLPYMSEYL